MDIRVIHRRLGIRCATVALAVLFPAVSAVGADWWIVSAGNQSPRFSAFVDADSIRPFDNPDPTGGRQLAAVEMKVVHEDGQQAVAQTHIYQVDCEKRRIRFAALYAHPSRIRRFLPGGSIYRVSEGRSSVTLSDARQAHWESPQASFQQQTVAFVCEPEVRAGNDLFGQLSIGERDPVELAVAAWDAHDESSTRGASQERSP